MTINNYLTKLVKKRKLLGRSEKKTSGRGQKGQGSRKSANVRQGFEGGQTPVYRRFPKRGFKRSKTSYQIINLEKLEKDQAIITEQLVDFSHKKLPVKILGKGELTKKITIKASFFSKSAQEKISKVGGGFQILEK